MATAENMYILICFVCCMLAANACEKKGLGDIKDLIEVVDYEISGEDLLQNFKKTGKALVMKGTTKKWPMYKALRNVNTFKETLQDVEVTSSMVHHESYATQKSTIGEFVKDSLYGSKFELPIEDTAINKMIQMPVAFTSCKKMLDDFARSHSLTLTGVKTLMRSEVLGSCTTKDIMFTVMSGTVRIHYLGKKNKAYMHSGDLAYFPRGQCMHIKSNGTFLGVTMTWNNTVTDASECDRPNAYSKMKDVKMTEQDWKMVNGDKEIPDKLLNTGYKMPVLGLGTARLLGQTYMSVASALGLGYRLIDTAQIYSGEDDYEDFTVSSEQEIGRAIKDSDVKREDIFLVTKLDSYFTSYEDAIKRFMTSLENLQTDYIDLFLIHDFASDKCKFGDKTGKCVKSRWQAWLALEELQSRGLVRSIGVSNIFPRDLKRLLKVAKSQVSVVQNWFDPLHQDREVREICSDNEIVYMGYGNFGNMWTDDFEMKKNPVLSNSVLTDISARNELSLTSVILRWAMEQDVVVIPCSTDLEHLEQNFNTQKQFLQETALDRIEKLDNAIGNPDVRGWKAPGTDGAHDVRDEL